MRNTWRQSFRRLAAGCITSVGVAWSSAMSYAVQLAYDTAEDPVYSAGWEEGQNGGFGFGAWNFGGTYITPPPGQHKMDDGLKSGGFGSSTYNNVGRAWSLFNEVFQEDSKDISQAGRSISPMQVGQTISIVFDNPTESMFFRGYTIRFNSGGANSCWEGDNCSTPENDPGAIVSRLAVGTFGWIPATTFGRWYPFEPEPGHYDVETAMGARLDFTLTGPETYQLVMTPFDTMFPPFSLSGNLQAGVNNEHLGKTIDWIEFEFYNTLSDPNFDTDFYIHSMEITGPEPAEVPGDYNNNGTVDAADYVLWRKGGPLQNEVAGVTPGVVTQEDYVAWRARFGNQITTGAGSELVAGSVPEPGTFTFLVLAAAGVLAVRRGRRPRG